MICLLYIISEANIQVTLDKGRDLKNLWKYEFCGSSVLAEFKLCAFITRFAADKEIWSGTAYGLLVKWQAYARDELMYMICKCGKRSTRNVAAFRNWLLEASKECDHCIVDNLITFVLKPKPVMLLPWTIVHCFFFFTW